MVFYTWVNWLANQRSSLLLSTCMLLLLTNLSWHSLDKDVNIECINNFWVWFLDWKNKSWMEVKWRLWKLLSKYIPSNYTLCSQTRGWSCGKLQKGLSITRANDTKGLKGVILDWITPPGQSLVPPIARNVKIDRGFNHKPFCVLPDSIGLTQSEFSQISFHCCIAMYVYLFTCRIKATLNSGELQVSRDQWPIFIYSHCEYDPEDPWKGAFQGALLVSVCYIFIGHLLFWHLTLL